MILWFWRKYSIYCFSGKLYLNTIFWLLGKHYFAVLTKIWFCYFDEKNNYIFGGNFNFTVFTRKNFITWFWWKTCFYILFCGKFWFLDLTKLDCIDVLNNSILRLAEPSVFKIGLDRWLNRTQPWTQRYKQSWVDGKT